MTIEKTITWSNHKLTLSTGRLAKQADAAVIVNLDDTIVLVTVVGEKKVSEARDFFPLTVNYQERSYAAGKIPGGFLKREGRPSEYETLVARLIDRPIRPLFPEDFTHEVQVTATVLSLNPNVLPDIPAMIGASAALAISGIPFLGPIGAVRVGYKDGIYQLNPSRSFLEKSDLDLVVAGTKDAVLMVESEAKELSEHVMLNAVLYGHEMMQAVIQLIQDMVKEVNPKPWTYVPHLVESSLIEKMKANYQDEIAKAYLIKDKVLRKENLQTIKEKAMTELASAATEDSTLLLQIDHAFSQLEKQIVRKRILAGEPRIDGRDTKTVRDINIDIGVLPRTHGSAIFTRGETQVLAVATLGTDRDSQIIDALEGERRDRFMLHYNFPPFCVGEIGMQTGPKRREIGHGHLARRALEAILPSEEEFPYVLRLVAEVLESNGSSSMATVCSSSLAMMDAGVPIKAPVSGIAMGLIKEGHDFAILTDILGDEDHLGDMDFKVAGTQNGVTALQMDIKIIGINKEIMEKALAQAYDARMHILQIMNNKLSTPRQMMSEHAPRIVTMQVPSDKIKDVIGKGGTTIRQLTEELGVTIDIQDDGTVKIFCVNNEMGEQAKKRIKQIVTGVAIGDVIEGKITRIVDFGAFVTLSPGKEGLLHISQISHKRVERVSDELSEGQTITVKVIDVDRQGRVKLSKKELDKPAAGG